jgi:hypothetical protein
VTFVPSEPRRLLPNNSLKPTRRARGQIGSRCPLVWAIKMSTWLLRRVGVRLAPVAGGG